MSATGRSRVGSRRGCSQLRRALAAGTIAVLVSCCLWSADRAWASISGGTQRWAASYHYGGPAFSYAVGVSPDGSTVFASGTTVYGSTRPGRNATLAYDASTGAEKWVATYSSSSNPAQRDRATRLAVSPDGSKVFVTGDSACFRCSGSYFEGWSTVAYDALTGTRLWVARHGARGGAGSIAVSPDGSKVVVNGREAGGQASATVAYDTSTGDQLWVIESDDAPVHWQALAVSPDSSTVFVGGMRDTLAEDFHTAAYDASDGTERWSALYPGGIPTALALSPDGSTVVVTGYDTTACCPNQSATVAYDASTGTQLWATQDDQIHVLPGDTTIDLAVSRDGAKVFVSGYDCEAHPCPDQPFATVAYDASSGNRLWVSRYRSGGRNYPNDLAVSPDGSKVFVTGQEIMPCYSPCSTAQVNAPLVAYDAATGDELWVADYENNLGFALAASPDGSTVYLAGTFTASTATSSAAAARGDRLRVTSASRTSCSPSACGYSTAAYNTGTGPGTSQDRDPSLRYNGWRNFFHKTALGGAYRASYVRGDSATYRTARTRSVVWRTHLGPNQGKAKVVIDGHSKGTFDLYSPTAAARSFTFKGLAATAHTVEIEVLGTKRASSKAKWVAVDGFKVGGNITVESSPRIRYDTWVGDSRRAASGGSYRKSGSYGARVSFAFTGGSIAWVTATGPAYGRARVKIDGVAHTVDLYRRIQNWRVRIWFTGLSGGTHNVTVRPLGTKHASSTSKNVVFDAFIVRS
jgi:WD40 repeat protein